MLLTILTLYLGKLTAKYLPLPAANFDGYFYQIINLKGFDDVCCFLRNQKIQIKIPESQETVPVCFARFSANALMRSSLNAEKFSGFVKTSANFFDVYKLRLV